MDAQKPEYRLSPKAEDDLEDIWFYTFETWGNEQADHYIDKLVTAFEKLVDNPQIAAIWGLVSEG